jgi:hypothetical protein
MMCSCPDVDSPFGIHRGYDRACPVHRGQPEPRLPSAEPSTRSRLAKALQHLELCEKEYAAIGTPGAFVLEHVLRPLRDRWNAGERSPALLEEILAVSL